MKKIKALLYCTKEKKQKDLLWSNNLKHFFLDGAYNRLIDNLPKYLLNGTIPCECEIEVEEICSEKIDVGVGYEPLFYTETTDDITKGSCLTQFEIENYLGCKEGGEVVGYAIHIKNLHIFDKPRELSDYYKFDGIYNDINNWKTIDKAPQNMMNVCDIKGNHYVLISIQPEELCRILNGEQTILIKKQVLNCMKGNE